MSDVGGFGVSMMEGGDRPMVEGLFMGFGKGG